MFVLIMQVRFGVGFQLQMCPAKNMFFFSGIGICYDNAFKLVQSCFCDVFVLS